MASPSVAAAMSETGVRHPNAAPQSSAFPSGGETGSCASLTPRFVSSSRPPPARESAELARGIAESTVAESTVAESTVAEPAGPARRSAPSASKA